MSKNTLSDKEIISLVNNNFLQLKLILELKIPFTIKEKHTVTSSQLLQEGMIGDMTFMQK